MLLSPATRSTSGVGKVEQGHVVDVSVFTRSSEHDAVARITSRRPGGAVGNGVTADPNRGNGPNVVHVGHGATVWGMLVPSSFHVPSFQSGGSGWAEGQSFHHTCTVTWLAADGPRELTSTTVTEPPTTRIASAVACHSGGFAGVGGTAGGG